MSEGIFEGLTSLQYVYLFNNQLAAPVEGEPFEGLTSLRQLWLWKNSIACADLGALPAKTMCYDSCADVSVDTMTWRMKARVEDKGFDKALSCTTASPTPDPDVEWRM
jgi:hypothetical protein